jgi:hypothetical protein
MLIIKFFAKSSPVVTVIYELQSYIFLRRCSMCSGPSYGANNKNFSALQVLQYKVARRMKQEPRGSTSSPKHVTLTKDEYELLP